MSATDTKTLNFVDLNTYTKVFSINVQGEITHLKVSEDEKYIAYKVNLLTTNFYVIENPLKTHSVHYYSSFDNHNTLVQYVLDIIQRKQPVYNKDIENTIIMPYKITLLHLYAYFGLHNHVKFSLANEGSITEDASGSSALLLSLKTNNKNSTLIFLKYFAKTLNTNPFIGNSISLSDLVLINSLGFSALHSFYDGLLCKNNFSKLPVVCNKKLQLPKFLISDEMIPDENWYITPDRKEEGVSIEFFASAVRINMITGSEESIKFYQSILDCECQEIFRSKFIQYYIDYK